MHTVKPDFSILLSKISRAQIWLNKQRYKSDNVIEFSKIIQNETITVKELEVFLDNFDYG